MLWEHRQEGIVLPKQPALTDSEAEQGLQEEWKVTSRCVWKERRGREWVANGDDRL